MKICFPVLLLFTILKIQAQSLSNDITINDLKHHMYYLASDSLQGRFPGNKGGNLAADYIAKNFKSAGLSLFQNNGFQYFEVLTNQRAGKKNNLKIGSKKLKAGTDFFPFPFSGDGVAEGKLAFAGYGLEIKNDTFQWNDYQCGCEDKIVMILRGSPDSDKYQNLFDNYSDDIVKAILARDKGAKAVILVSGKKYDDSDKLPQMNLKESPAGIPVIQLKREIAGKILDTSGKKLEFLEENYQKEFKPGSFESGQNVWLETEVIKIKAKTQNVIGYVYATDTAQSKGFIIIGAHYDHLGMGGVGSASRIQDTVAIHNGADDNASGVSVLLEMAAKFQQEKDKLKYNLIFVAFGAEEMGILGSKYFVEHPPVALSKIKAMVNLDMVGRLKEDTMLQVNGTGTSKEAPGIVNELNADYHFNLRMSPEGYGPSDHAAFYAKNIPVFFLTTGAHTDYHTPSDDREKINFEGMQKVSLFASDLVRNLANSGSLLTFQEAGPQKRAAPGRRYKITLGIMPDINGTTNNGLLVEFVTKGKPAYNGGMLKGDIITSVNGKPVNNIQDYMVRLSQLKAGQSVNVEVLRNNKKELLIIQL